MVVIYPQKEKKKKKFIFANELWVKWVEGRVMGSKSIHCKIILFHLQSRVSLGSYITIIFAIVSAIILDYGVRRFWGLVWKINSSYLWVGCGECSLLMIFLPWLLFSYLFTSFKTLPFKEGWIWYMDGKFYAFKLCSGFWSDNGVKMCKWLRHFLQIMDSKLFYWHWRWWMRYHFSKVQLSFRRF